MENDDFGVSFGKDRANNPSSLCVEVVSTGGDHSSKDDNTRGDQGKSDEISSYDIQVTLQVNFLIKVERK